MTKIRIITATLFFCILSACGGGNNQETDATLFASDVFAEPSGPLCSVRKSDPILQLEYCLEPTASSASPDQLLEALTNSNYPYIEFTGIGVRLIEQLNSILYNGLQQKHVLLHADHIHDGEKLYDYYPSIGDDHTRAYVTSPTGISSLNRDIDPQAFQMFQSTPPINLIQGDWNMWHAFLGMRTDWLTAPTEKTVRLHGHAEVIAGDGHHLPVLTPSGESSSKTTGQCPIEMELDTESGYITLKNSPVTCIDAETGAQMTLAISELGLRSEASVIKVGISESAVVASLVSAPHEVSLIADSIHEITGGIYGDGAQFLIVQGTSSNAEILVVARRLD